MIFIIIGRSIRVNRNERSVKFESINGARLYRAHEEFVCAPCQNKRRTHQEELARARAPTANTAEIVIETTNFMVIIVGVSYCFIKNAEKLSSFVVSVFFFFSTLLFGSNCFSSGIFAYFFFLSFNHFVSVCSVSCREFEVEQKRFLSFRFR